MTIVPKSAPSTRPIAESLHASAKTIHATGPEESWNAPMKISMNMKSVSYYLVTTKIPIKSWQMHIATWPQIKIVRLPNLAIGNGAKHPTTKFTIPTIRVPSCGVIGKVP